MPREAVEGEGNPAGRLTAFGSFGLLRFVVRNAGERQPVSLDGWSSPWNGTRLKHKERKLALDKLLESVCHYISERTVHRPRHFAAEQNEPI